MSTLPGAWCEFCRDHFEVSHFDDEGNHKVGKEYGPHGEDMAELACAKSDAAACAEFVIGGLPLYKRSNPLLKDNDLEAAARRTLAWAREERNDG